MYENFQAFVGASFEGVAEGTWLAYVEGREVASDADLKALILKVKQTNPHATPTFAQVPTEDTLIL